MTQGFRIQPKAKISYVLKEQVLISNKQFFSAFIGPTKGKA